MLFLEARCLHCVDIEDGQDLRVDEVDANVIILDQDLAFFGLGNGEVGLILQDLSTAILLHDHALHSFRDGRHCAGMCEAVCWRELSDQSSCATSGVR
jgi:hypothetical protein